MKNRNWVILTLIAGASVYASATTRVNAKRLADRMKSGENVKCVDNFIYQWGIENPTEIKKFKEMATIVTD